MVIMKRSGKHCLLSRKTRRNLGCYPTRAGAEQREREVAYFKRAKRREVHVRPYLSRRRLPPQRIALPDELPIVGSARGETTDKGSLVFLPAHTEALKEYAWVHGVELKEAHFRDDVIETMVHESLHEAMRSNGTREAIQIDFARRGYPWHWARQAEEQVVEKITKETMRDIRELPPLGRRRPGGAR